MEVIEKERGGVIVEKDFKEFLEQKRILPYKNGNWNEVSIDHSQGSNKSVERNKIATLLKDVESGVYIYTSMNNKVLYIGEGNIKGRLKRHYRKSYKNEIKGPRDIFFNSDEQKIKMTIYYLEIADKYERQAIEAMLTAILKPKYNKLLRGKLLVKS